MNQKITNFLRGIQAISKTEVFDMRTHRALYVTNIVHYGGISRDLAESSLNNMDVLPKRLDVLFAEAETPQPENVVEITAEVEVTEVAEVSEVAEDPQEVSVSEDTTVVEEPVVAEEPDVAAEPASESDTEASVQDEVIVDEQEAAAVSTTPRKKQRGR